MDNNFIEELNWLDRLNEDDDLFEQEFESIKNKYPIRKLDEIHDFFSENRGLIVILNKIEPLLKRHVPYARIYLELDEDPLFTPQLWLFVRAPKVNFGNGFKQNIKLINSKIEPLQFRLNLGREFFICDGMIHSRSHFW